MGSNEVNRSTSPAATVEHDAVKSPPPPDELQSPSSDDDEDDGSSPSGSTQPPPNQEMERYRIPASVFERNKSSTPGDWSMASNESLFSIHMSFTNDQYNDLGPPPASSDHMFCYSPHSSSELGLAEATMLEVIKENEGRSPPIKIPPAHRSAGSNQSNMSFAFSVAGGDTERIPSSIKSSVSPENININADAAHEQDVQSPPEKPKSKWLFCCPCLSFCFPGG